MRRPTLAVSIDSEEQLTKVIREHGTLMVSKKEDGIRACTDEFVLLSREGKRIPNKHLQKEFRLLPAGLEGELVFSIDGSDKRPPLEHINSIVTSKSKHWPKRWEPRFCAFDWQPRLGSSQTFRQRYKQLLKLRDALDDPCFQVINQHEMNRA